MCGAVDRRAPPRRGSVSGSQAELQLEGAKKVTLEDKRGPRASSGVALHPGELADMVIECPLGPSGAYTSAELPCSPLPQSPD